MRRRLGEGGATIRRKSGISLLDKSQAASRCASSLPRNKGAGPVPVMPEACFQHDPEAEASAPRLSGTPRVESIGVPALDDFRAVRSNHRGRDDGWKRLADRRPLGAFGLAM